jgi:PAS domain S-box-containing protein
MDLAEKKRCSGKTKFAARVGVAIWMTLAGFIVVPCQAWSSPTLDRFVGGIFADNGWFILLMAILLAGLLASLIRSEINKWHRNLVEEQLRLDEAGLEALVKLSHMQAAPLSEYANYTLEQAVSLTRSKLGFISFVSEDEKTLSLFAWSAGTMKMCAMKEKPEIFSLEKGGLWGEPIRQRKPIIVNDYAAPSTQKHGLPEGHVPLTRFLGVPVFEGERIVAEVCVANKSEPYQESDIRQLTLLMQAMWHLYQKEQRTDALRKSEMRLKQTERVGKVGGWELDLETESLIWTDETYRIFGQDPLKFFPTRATFREFVLPEDRVRVRNAMNAAMSSGDGYKVDHRIILPGGVVRWVHEEAEVCVSMEGPPIRLIGTIQDITEHRQLEEKYRQAKKLQAVGLLAGGVAHEFNNILTIIQGHVALATLGCNPKDDVRESLEEVQKAAERAARLTRQLLAFSQRQMLQLRYLDLNEVVGNMSKMLNRLLGERIQLKFEKTESLPGIQADAGTIEQVITNLVINARDAMRSGGTVTLRTRAENFTEEDSWKNPDVHPGSFVCLEIQDTGCGMDVSTTSHLFEPFFTTKEMGHGTGLGLAMVYGIIRQHEGWIEVESKQGAGSVFRVFLPACSKPAAAPPAPIIKPDLTGGHETILAVEDEMPVRMLARVCLQRKGYRVLEASNGREALDVWKKHKDEIDLLLTDQIMPEGMSGCELATHCLAEKPSLKVIYSSGYSLEMIEAGKNLTEGLNFLAKPYDPAKLANTVRHCLDS